jgi:oligopeptide/dipeptide ABC transporter ATP-binding protein
MSSASEPLVAVRDLVKHFPITRGVILERGVGAVKAVDGVSFQVRGGETLGIVGETGCGKSTTARLIMRLLEASSGEVRFDGRDITRLKGASLKAVRREMQMIFQDPYSSLNPRKTIGSIIAEPFAVHGLHKGKGERKAAVQELMGTVGLNPEHYNRYPHEFSGGQRQRIGVARALALRPKLLIADEPVSALDVSIQAQVLNLLRDLQRRFGLTLIFIAHDLSVVRHMCDRVAVMYLGKIVEIGPSEQLYGFPRHPYTGALLSAVPVPDPTTPQRTKAILGGDVPSPANPPAACRLHTRCPKAQERCRTEAPLLEHKGTGSEVQGLLQALIRFDTVNPPGNERPAQEHLAACLSAEGLECELLGASDERPNLIARLRGAGEGPTLCYLGHVDTVLADAAEWRHDPWSGELADGCVWGRGALDMKSQVAAEVAAAASLARSGWRPARGELLIVTVVDEETGGSLGAEWITVNHPGKVRCDLLVNEGGGAVFEYRGRRCYGVCCAEKGVFRFKLTTDGVAGHASMPGMGENALLKMGPALDRFAARQPSYRLTEEPLAFLGGIGEDPDDPDGSIARLREADPRLAVMFEPMLGVTFTPTRIAASQKINVIPSRAELKVDCRVPPGLGEEQVLEGLTEVLGSYALDDPTGAQATDAAGGEGPWRVEFTERVVGNRSPLSSQLMDELSRWIAEHDPGAQVVPVVLPGFTDSRHFRLAFPECVAYGFFPQRHMSMLESTPLIHGADERIDVRDLGFASELFRDLAVRVLG